MTPSKVLKTNPKESSSPGAIFVMGGGGFSMEPENPLLDRYILSLSKAQKPKICLLPTASWDSPDYIRRFYRRFSLENCRPSHLSLFKPFTGNISGFLLKQHIIFVGGGNTRNLLCLWKEWGLNEILKKFLDKGGILAGISAGGLCWFESGVSDYRGVGLSVLPGLGWLKGSFCPHYDSEPERPPFFTQKITEAELPKGYGFPDSTGGLFREGELVEFVSSLPGLSGFAIKNSPEFLIRPLSSRYLGVGESVFRRGMERDIQDLLKIQAASIKKGWQGFYTHSEITNWLTHLKRNEEKFKLRIGAGKIVVYEILGKCRGFLEWDKGEGELLIKKLYLHPSIFKKGIGREFLKIAEDKARDFGLNRISLSSSRNALQFYRNQGFVGEDEFNCSTDSGMEITGIHMVKRL